MHIHIEHMVAYGDEFGCKLTLNHQFYGSLLRYHIIGLGEIADITATAQQPPPPIVGVWIASRVLDVNGRVRGRR
jgi:hypothetical protein